MTGQKTRSRVIKLSEAETEWGTRNAPPFTPFDTTFTSSGVLFTTQTTVSEGHPWHLLGRQGADLGGEFFSSRSFHSHNSPWIEVRSSSGFPYSYFNGRVWPKLDASDSVPVDDLEPLERSTDSQLDAAGTTAISRVLPTNPIAGLTVTFAELREGFPKLIGTALFKRGLKGLLRGSGEELLNFEFGIRPLISDLKKWAYAYSHASKLWDQFLRDSGRLVRRRYSFPESEEVLVDSISSAPCKGAGIEATPSLWQGGTNSFSLYSQSVLKRKRWFSGAFSYYIDQSPDQRSQQRLMSRRLEYLYGAGFSPQAIWNLAPWSWAVDWITNLGDVITNLSQFSEDGLVMPYGYLMERSTRESTYRMRNVTPKGYNIPDLTQVFRHEVKYRRRATPYGFGLDEQSFTARQWAIIAALGLSRAR